MTALSFDSMYCVTRRLAWYAGARRLFALLGIAALCLQAFAPDMAKAATMDWIEICSDAGIKTIQVDLSDGSSAPDQPCPKCDSCTFCAISLAGLTSNQPDLAAQFSSALPADVSQNQTVLRERRYFWPSTRGPPRRRNENKDRVFRAFPVSYSYKGEAL
ncbi:DUF2946 family protein [Pelagimonas varians]|uniref:Uncharacterized protein n=1 Tax=Pelagimonas varians TaxID=696760 RepID=A0A238KNI3_9RHOB|nr:DUF2946 family protein [Pelagimonas varians]PYG28896.1 hypothetical protein C8N36_110119 [Pelagimonas varians]SMX44197.1 hypothetical protein PEV8663_02814 [Pelagimonas varians]